VEIGASRRGDRHFHIEPDVFRVLAVVPFDDEDAKILGMLQVEAA
jgi:hypothetical protein